MTVASNTEAKYSILIPTKNGGTYLKFAIESVLKQNYSNFELIVSNNHSSDGSAEYLSSLTDHRLKVISPESPLPMAEHYEFLIEHATGQWMTIIGDDDALMPYFFESLEKITNQSQEVGIISSARAYYFWRGCTPEHGDYAVRYRSSPRQEMRSTKQDLLLALLGLKSCFDLPQLYTSCIIKRDWVQSLKKIQGGYMYHSIIPDMYSAVALAFNFDSYLRVDKPLFWVGTSNKSMGLSTRIYEDSKQNLSIQKDRLSLNPDIPQEIHAAGFGTMYLYECLLQYPVNNKLFLNKKIIIIFIMGSILRQIKLEKYNIKISQENLVTAFRQYISSLQLSYISVRIASIFLIAANVFYKAYRYSYVLWVFLCSRLNIKNYVYFLSKDHDAFSNIEYASRFINKKMIKNTFSE